MAELSPAAAHAGEVRRWDMDTARAAWWAFVTARRVKRALKRTGLDSALYPPVPALPAHAERGVAAMLRRRRDTCLVRTIVLQAWYAAQGTSRDLIIGVRDQGRGFEAHAWLEGDASESGETFHELTRRSAA